jgi:hypothetical protein
VYRELERAGRSCTEWRYEQTGDRAAAVGAVSEGGRCAMQKQSRLLLVVCVLLGGGEVVAMAVGEGAAVSFCVAAICWGSCGTK